MCHEKNVTSVETHYYNYFTNRNDMRKPYYIYLQKRSLLYRSLQNTVDAKSEDNNEKNPDEIYISIPDEEWNNFAKNFSIQVYNNKADYKKSSLLFSTLLSLLGGVLHFYKLPC